MYCIISNRASSWRVLFETLMLLLVVCTFFSGRMLHEAQSFVLVPSPQQHNYYPHPLSAQQHRWKHHCWKKTALFVGDSEDREFQIAINKKLVELGKKQQWREILEVAKEEQTSFNDVNYATLMSQLGRIRSFNREDPRFVGFLKAMATVIEERGLPWIHTSTVANIIFAIGKMRLRNPSTERILEWISKPEIAAEFVEDGNPHAIANVAWACATLGFQSPELFAEIERWSEWLVEKRDPLAVSNTAWACARLGFEAPNLFAEIDRQSKWLVETEALRAVANTAWACAALGYEVPNLFAEIDCQPKLLVETGFPQAVANTAWAFATLGYEASELFIEFDQHADRLLEYGNLQHLSIMCYAIAVLGMSKGLEPLLAKLWERSI